MYNPPPPPPSRAVSAALGGTGDFSGFSWLIGTALRNFLTVMTLGGVSQFSRQFAIYCFFGGSPAQGG